MEKNKVMIHRADYSSCREAVERAFEIFPLDVKGKKVLVKPNALRKSKPEEGIVTHPALVRAVVERLESLGPSKIIVGDNPGLFSYGDNEETFRESGLMEASKGYYVNIGKQAVEVGFNPRFSEKVKVSKAIMEADVLISLPKFKTHGLTVVTGAIKNSYGFLPGAQKARLHLLAGSPERFHELIVDVFSIRVPDLIVVDAVVGMEGNGPASKDLREIGCILASDNGVAMDATIARMMGLEPQRLPFICTAAQRGLGSYATESIEIVGELRTLENFKLPDSAGGAVAGTAQVADLMLQRTKMRPKADPALCTGCGTCVDHCPAGALSLVAGLPTVNIGSCITCFCCQEICPERAIHLTGS